jgi:hypothetical protein
VTTGHGTGGALGHEVRDAAGAIPEVRTRRRLDVEVDTRARETAANCGTELEVHSLGDDRFLGLLLEGARRGGGHDGSKDDPDGNREELYGQPPVLRAPRSTRDRREQLGVGLSMHRSSFVRSCGRLCDGLLAEKMCSGAESRLRGR